MDAGRVFFDLESGPSVLDRDEAGRRLQLYGSNQLDVDDSVPAWRVLVHQFMLPLNVMLALCAVVVLIRQHWVDAGRHPFALVVNAAPEFLAGAQGGEGCPCSDVLRNGARITVPAAELTRGDVVVLEAGTGCRRT